MLIVSTGSECRAQRFATACGKEHVAMKPILRAYLSACDSRRLTLDCGDSAAMRIVALTDDIVQVTLLRGGEVR